MIDTDRAQTVFATTALSLGDWLRASSVAASILLILSAGGYKFSDIFRVGIPLAIIMWIGFSIVLPLLYDI